MKLNVLLFFLAFLVAPVLLPAQNISGSINTYTNVTAVTANTITVGSAASFSSCDRVMIIQMKGATVNTGNNASFGQVTAYNNAGNYEFANIASIAGSVITLTAPLNLTYTPAGGVVQLVRVPLYTAPVITATLTCAAFNGTTGGVLVFESTGPVTFNANIDVTGLGFRGGGVYTGGFNCGDPNYANGFAGRKGESIIVTPAGMDSHRAPLASGGGGSTPGNAGSGGGGNFGAGGRGGNEYSGCGGTGVFGLGGYAMTTNVNKAFAGGGGGGGFRDNGYTAATGSNGGGIVMINAPSIAGNGFSIFARGVNVTTVTNDEGAGAGGAGGSVYLRVPSYTSALTVNVNGGNGGNIQNFAFTFDCHGPGGGGGGGYVWSSTASMPANLAVTSTGGNPGLALHAGAYFNTPYGAVGGTAGSTLYNLPAIPVSSPQTGPPVNLGPDTIICGGGNITLHADTIYPGYLWSTAATTDSIVVTTSGTYWLECPVGCGMFDRDSIVITINNPVVNLGPDQSFCQGDSAQFNAGAGFAIYNWSTGAATASISTQSTGSYSVVVTDAAGCTASDTADVINIFTNPVISLGPDTTFCGTSIVLSPGAGYAGYLWQNNSTNSSYTATASNTYFVQVTDANTCTDADTIVVTILPVPNPNLGPDQSFCFGNTIILNPGTFTSYAWSTGVTTPTITVGAAGTYIVGVMNASGCIDSDTMVVQNVYPLPVANLGPDQPLCQGDNIVLSPGNFSSYLWQNGSTGNSFSVSAGGQYIVEVTDNNNCVDKDTMVVTLNPLPVFSLGPDGKVCPGESFLITPTDPGVSVTYLWSDNTTTGSLIVFNFGTYYLTMTNPATGCDYTDTVEVLLQCPPTIYVPTAFTPNGDNFNSYFLARGTNIKDFKMEIFNRWGQHIYTSNGLVDGWDGRIGIDPAPIGVYIYKITYRSFVIDDDQVLMGGFSLIR